MFTFVGGPKNKGGPKTKWTRKPQGPPTRRATTDSVSESRFIPATEEGSKHLANPIPKGSDSAAFYTTFKVNPKPKTRGRRATTDSSKATTDSGLIPTTEKSSRHLPANPIPGGSDSAHYSTFWPDAPLHPLHPLESTMSTGPHPIPQYSSSPAHGGMDPRSGLPYNPDDPRRAAAMGNIEFLSDSQ